MGRKQSDWVWAQDPGPYKDGHTPHSKHWTSPLPTGRNRRDRGRDCRGQRIVALETSAPLTPTLNLYYSKLQTCSVPSSSSSSNVSLCQSQNSQKKKTLEMQPTLSTDHTN